MLEQESGLKKKSINMVFDKDSPDKEMSEVAHYLIHGLPIDEYGLIKLKGRELVRFALKYTIKSHIKRDQVDNTLKPDSSIATDPDDSFDLPNDLFSE